MAMFLGEISFLFALSVFVAGLTLWHFGGQRSAAPLRAGGVVAMLGAGLTALCTGYFMVQYRVRGDFESAYPFQSAMGGTGMMESGATMRPGSMMQDPEMMKRHGMMMRMQEGMGPGASSSEGEGETPGQEVPQ